jgi:hypothetical protein
MYCWITITILRGNVVIGRVVDSTVTVEGLHGARLLKGQIKELHCALGVRASIATLVLVERDRPCVLRQLWQVCRQLVCRNTGRQNIGS